MHCNWVKQKSFSSALLEAQSCLEAHWVEETASTNDDVKEWVKKADEDIAVALVTDRQTAGRGTRGRRWTAPAASVLYRFPFQRATSRDCLRLWGRLVPNLFGNSIPM